MDIEYIQAQKQSQLDLAVADLRDFMARARRLRLQFDHAKQEELTAYRKVQSCQESLTHCYANNPFGGMNDIIERRKTQLAEAERGWQETTLYVAQLRSEVAEISEMEIERFTPEVAQRMREQDEQELLCANEMIIDGTTNTTAPKSLEAIKVVAKESDIRTAMVYGSTDGRPTTAADRALALSMSSPSRGASPMVAGRIGSPSHYTVVGSNGSSSRKELPPPKPIAITALATSATDANKSAMALVAADVSTASNTTFNNNNNNNSPSRALPFSLTPVRSSTGERVGSAIAATAYSNSMRQRPTSANVAETHSSGLRAAAAAAGVVPGAEHRLPSAIRGSAQSPLKMSSVNFRDSDQHAVVVARPGNYSEQSALLASSNELARPSTGKLNHLAALHDDGSGAIGSGDPEGYRYMINGQLPQIALSPSQQRALEHSPFFRPGSAIVYAAADAAASNAQRGDNLDNSKCAPLSAVQVGRDRRPLSRPAYYASPVAEKVKYSLTTPNTPLTELELNELFNTLDGDADGMLTMVEVAKHFDKVGTFGIPNHSKKFIEGNLKRAFSVEALVSYDEFSYLVAKWGTL